MNFFKLFLLFLNAFFFIFHSKIANFYNIYDKPDSVRKYHKLPTSLIGGLILFLNFYYFIIYSILFQNFYENEIFVSNKTLFNLFFLNSSFFLIGYLDDKFNISANKKFITIFLIILTAVLIDKNLIINELRFSSFYKVIYLENFSIIFTTLCILLFINAFNMFDGINCQAGLYAFGLLVVLFLNSQSINIFLTFIIPLLFFLYFNYKDKMFLGNSGSLFLSILLSQLIILEYSNNKLLADEIVLLLIFPGLDMLRLFIERLLRNKSPFDADRAHIHHFISNKLNNFYTVFLTVGVQFFVFFVYYFTKFKSYYFIFFLVFYYLSLYFFFSKNDAKKPIN